MTDTIDTRPREAVPPGEDWPFPSLEYDEHTNTYCATCEDSTLSTAIVMLVALVTDAKPTQLPILADSINPDALDKLFTDTDDAGDTDGQVSFLYAGCEVRIRDDGTIAVTPTELTR